jgi:hypothetical protein
MFPGRVLCRERTRRGILDFGFWTAEGRQEWKVKNESRQVVTRSAKCDEVDG